MIIETISGEALPDGKRTDMQAPIQMLVER
jgi:hypothetical protein